MFSVCGLFFFGGLVAFVWLVCSLFRQDVFRTPARVIGWMSVFAVPPLAVVLVSADCATAVRVYLCEDQLRDYAEQSDGHRPTRGQPDRVGLFAVYSLERVDDGLALLTVDEGLIRGGLIYAPHRPPHRGLSPIRHLNGPWYRYVVPD